MAQPANKLRVLVLHGYASNAVAYKRRLGALQKACRNVAEFVFLDGPIRVTPLPSESNPDPTPQKADEPMETQTRGWWERFEDRYEGWETTTEYLYARFRELGPFDGVLGYSQGGCLAGVLAAALEHPELVPNAPRPFQEQPLRFAISVSGFRPRPHLFTPLMQAGITTPMLIVQGQEDQIVPIELTNTLTQLCSNVRVAEHSGGHFLPTSAPWRNFVRDVLAAFRDDAPDAWRSIPAPPLSDENSDFKL